MGCRQSLIPKRNHSKGYLIKCNLPCQSRFKYWINDIICMSEMEYCVVCPICYQYINVKNKIPQTVFNNLKNYENSDEESSSEKATYK